MPLYDVEHVTYLDSSQQEHLAVAITDLHATTFNTPRFFVNVRFTDVSNQVVFRGGVRRKYDRIILRTRTGSDRTAERYNQYCASICLKWEGIVGQPLRTVWVLGALTTALECGIARPKTGDEVAWLHQHREEFQKLANAGDEDFIDLIEGLKTRPELQVI